MGGLAKSAKRVRPSCGRGLFIEHFPAYAALLADFLTPFSWIFSVQFLRVFLRILRTVYYVNSLYSYKSSDIFSSI